MNSCSQSRPSAWLLLSARLCLSGWLQLERLRYTKRYSRLVACVPARVCVSVCESYHGIEEAPALQRLCVGRGRTRKLHHPSREEEVKEGEGGGSGVEDGTRRSADAERHHGGLPSLPLRLPQRRLMDGGHLYSCALAARLNSQPLASASRSVSRAALRPRPPPPHNNTQWAGGREAESRAR